MTQTASRIESPAPTAAQRAAPFLLSEQGRAGLLALEEGVVQLGLLRGAPLPAEGDLIFTTAATGWGEILTDPSYAGQIVVLTHPMAGNYRIDPDELESSRVHARALVVSRLVASGRTSELPQLEDTVLHIQLSLLAGPLAAAAARR